MILQRLTGSIVTRVIMLGLGLLLFGAVARYGALTLFMREDLGSVVAAQQLALASYVARDIDHKIAERRALLERIAEALPTDYLGQPERLRAWLGQYHTVHPLFSTGLFVTDPRGTVLADFPARLERSSINYGDRDYLLGAAAGAPFIGRPVIGRVAREPVLPMAVPVKDDAGVVRAVLVGITALAAPDFLDSLQKSRIGETGGFLLVSPRDKLFVASTQPEMMLRPTPPPGVNLLHDRAMTGFRGSGVTTNAKGIEEVAAIVSVPSTGWFVVARLPTAEAFATIDRVQRLVISGSSVALLIFLVVVPAGLILLFRPLMRAADHADRMTLGELPLQPLPVARDDEVGHLTAAFNRLLAKLTDSQVELVRMAHHDLLTGLPNRRLLADRLQQALAQAKRKDSQLALLFLDLDGFKQINDTLGHDAGDEALCQVASRLTRAVRQADTLARVGGDEFVLLLCDLDEYAEAAASVVATKCIEVLALPFDVRGQTCRLGVSIGVALGGGDHLAEHQTAEHQTGDNQAVDNQAADALLLAADQAMYRAKAAGRGRYEIHRL